MNFFGDEDLNPSGYLLEVEIQNIFMKGQVNDTARTTF